MKQYLKQVTPEFIQQFWRKLNRRRYERISALNAAHLTKLGQVVAEHYNLVVADGPFRGMRYINEAFCGGYAPKILGCYESELHDVIDEIINQGYKLIVDIGAAEGYYAVGLAYRIPTATVYAFELVPYARALCGELARVNKLSERVTLREECNSEELANLPLDSSTLIICDCEGCEIDLLNPMVTPGLLFCDILVEMHDFQNPSITPTLTSRFSSTHDIALIDSKPHAPSDYPAAAFLADPADRALAVNDLRGASMQWAFMKSRTRNRKAPLADLTLSSPL